jgi:hypothetical protein
MDVDNNTADPSFWAGKTLCLGYGFLVLIMLHIYTAASAVQLTQEKSSNQITSITDLQGRPVITPFNYVQPLAKRSLFPTGAPWWVAFSGGRHRRSIVRLRTRALG